MTTADARSVSSFSKLQEGVEQTDSYSSLESRGVTCILKESGQDVFSRPEPSLEVEASVDNWQINDQNLDFMMNKIADRGGSG